MSLFAYLKIGTPESRSFQFFWTAGTRPVFRLAFRVFQRLSHLPDPRSRAGEWGDPGPTCPDNGPAATPGGSRPKVVDEDEDVYAGDGMSSSEHVPAAAPSSTLFSDAPPPLDRTSNSAMVDPHTIDPFFEPLGTPARLNSTASLARSLSAWTDGTPTIRIVPDTPSGAEVQRTRHGLHDALVRAGCWSIPAEGAGALHDESSLVSCRRSR